MKIYTKEMIKEKNSRKIKIKKKLATLMTPVIILMIVFCVFIIYQKYMMKSSSIEIMGYKAYIVLTGSMKPVLNPDDLVVVHKVPQESLKVGDIITFSASGNNTITHRITDITQENGQTYYKTKGDNNSSADSDVVTYDNIQGVYQFKISRVGAILTGGLTGTGLMLVFLVLAICYHHASKMEDRMLTREEARKRYNVYKYKDEENVNGSI